MEFGCQASRFFLWSVKNQGGFKVGGQAGISDGVFLWSVHYCLRKRQGQGRRSDKETSSFFVYRAFVHTVSLCTVYLNLRRIHVDMSNFI